MIRESKLPPFVTDNQIANINDEEFLFIFSFPKFEYDFWFGISLQKAVLLISFCFILSGASTFLSVLKTNNTFNFISSLSILSIYSIAFLLLLISSCNHSYVISYIAYLIYSGVLFVNILEVIVMSFLIAIGVYSPNGLENPIIKAFSFLLIGIMVSCVYMYFLWIIFCYVIHLKYNRVELVCGEFEKIKNRTSEIGEINYRALKDGLQE